MSTIQLLLVCATVLVLGLAFIGRTRTPAVSGVFDSLTPGGEVAVYTSGEQSIRGTALGVQDGCLELARAALVTGGQTIPLGDVSIPERSATFVQRLAAKPVSAVADRRSATA